jgi:hypothetical protein
MKSLYLNAITKYKTILLLKKIDFEIINLKFVKNNELKYTHMSALYSFELT